MLSFWLHGLSPFRHVADLTVALLACRRFDHTPHQILGESLNPVYTIQPVLIPVEQPVECLYTRYHRLSKRLSNRFDSLTTGWTTGCIVYTNIQPVVQPVIWIQPVWFMQPNMQSVVQPVWQPVVSCKRGLTFSAGQYPITQRREWQSTFFRLTLASVKPWFHVKIKLF